MNEQIPPESTARPTKVDSTLSKGLQILEALARSDGRKGVTELSRELNLTKSNTFRLLQTLTTLGYVKHSEDKSYSPTMKMVMSRTPLKRVGGPREIGDVVAFLASEKASYITGETIYVDGGRIGMEVYAFVALIYWAFIFSLGQYGEYLKRRMAVATH